VTIQTVQNLVCNSNCSILSKKRNVELPHLANVVVEGLNRELPVRLEVLSAGKVRHFGPGSLRGLSRFWKQTVSDFCIHSIQQLRVQQVDKIPQELGRFICPPDNKQSVLCLQSPVMDVPSGAVTVHSVLLVASVVPKEEFLREMQSVGQTHPWCARAATADRRRPSSRRRRSWQSSRRGRRAPPPIWTLSVGCNEERRFESPLYASHHAL
jgi:hypothetical protein